MKILTTAIGYQQEQVQHFVTSLERTGFSGELVVLANKSPAAEYLKKHKATILLILISRLFPPLFQLMFQLKP